MKVSRAQAEENRQRIIETASRLFRERGFDGIGVNDLMQAAGLTRGGFYGHFESKQDLARQASDQALQDNLAQWTRVVENSRGDALAALVQFYLSNAHRERIAGGCTLVGLAGDAARQPAELQESFWGGVERFIELLQTLLPRETEAASREAAMGALATLVGGLLLSRAVGEGKLSRELLHAARHGVLALGGEREADEAAGDPAGPR